MSEPDAVVRSPDQPVDVNSQEIERLARYDRTSWWIRGRRALITSVLRARMASAASGKVGDLGCGAGGMFEIFRQFGDVAGIDISSTAVALCRAKPYEGLAIGTLSQLPLRGESLDLAGMTDVLEHVEDDEQVIRECLRVLKPGGVLLITVPALRWLYSEHDRALGHFRRYSGDDLRRLLARCGFRVERITHFNVMLLPLAVVYRLVSRLRRGLKPQADPLDLADPWNWLAYRALLVERALMKFLDFPTGLSLLCLVRKPGRGDAAPKGLAEPAR